jgi:high-affinity iron transporter
MVLFGAFAAARGGEVAGRVEMPQICSPSVSPAVVWLEPLDAGINLAGASGSARPAEARLVRQRDLQFQPRVQAMALGERLQFTNADQEPHNVHLTGAGASFNQTMRPGDTLEFTPKKPGVVQLFCDIHIHMRGYVLVSPNRAFSVCGRDGRFRVRDVPEGRFRVHVWHEMGPESNFEITTTSAPLDLGTLSLTAYPPKFAGASKSKHEPWPNVLDQVSLSCSAALDAAQTRQPSAATKAVSLVDDAYLGVFEASDMEVAIGSLLGYDRVIAVESMFRALRREARGVADGSVEPTRFSASIRALLTELVRAARDLQTLNVSDGSKIAAATGRQPGAVVDSTVDSTSIAAHRNRLNLALDKVAALVEQGQRPEAANELVTTYFERFEPIERILQSRNPAVVRPLETRFVILRGQIEAGLEAHFVDSELASLRHEIDSALATAPQGAATEFGVMFLASLSASVREGVEIILILGVLGTLITRAGNPQGARRALWLGVLIGFVASAFTALGLQMLVSSARNQSRELIEGFVMLVASGVLFYVSYWLIAQSESKRWIDFLKQAAAKGSAHGRFFSLGLAAFLAVYREGAEIALMYQGMLGGQSRMGVSGVVILALLALFIRFSSKKLPTKSFFQVSGGLLFALAVVFAGHGVLALQTAGVVRASALQFIGTGLPALGFHPTLQGLAVQGILIAGAVLGLLSLLINRRSQLPRQNEASKPSLQARTTAAPAGVEAAH